MTGNEKTALAQFLDLAGDYLSCGHRRVREEYAFTDDTADSAPSDENTCLPLAYMVEEPADSPESADSLEIIYSKITNCENCMLAATRTRTVPGEGVSNPLVMVIGEGPGADEDAAGRPFVGKAGQLLDKMLASIKLSRETNCYIANMVKCRPPENRDPAPEEIIACYPYLERQILLLRPKVILCAGRVAAQNLLKTSKGINAMRGRFNELKLGDDLTIPVLPTLHPSAVQRDPDNNRRPAWEDLKLLRAKLDTFIDPSSMPVL